MMQEASQYLLLFKSHSTVVSLNCCRDRLYIKLRNIKLQSLVWSIQICRILGSVMMNGNIQKNLSPMPIYRVQTTENIAKSVMTV